MLLEALLLAGAAGLVTLALGLAHPDTPPATRLLMVVAGPTLLAPLFVGNTFAPSSGIVVRVAGWSLATLLFGIVVALVTGSLPTTRLAPLLLMAFGVVVITQLAMSVATRALCAAGRHTETATEWSRWLGVAILWLLAAVPLWLGPLASLGAQSGPGYASALVAASPLVHLGVAAGQDLLRTQWFYAHTSFGSLQFDYPSSAGIAQAYLAIALALAAVDFALTRLARPRMHVRETPPTQEHVR